MLERPVSNVKLDSFESQNALDLVDERKLKRILVRSTAAAADGGELQTRRRKDLHEG